MHATNATALAADRRAAALFLAVLSTLSIAVAPAAGQDCRGDCNGSSTVALGEVITCVRIGLSALPLSVCPPCSATETVRITDLVAVVDSSLGRCPTPTPTDSAIPTDTATLTPTDSATPADTATATPISVCGNRVVEGDEECDDGGFCAGDSVNVSCVDQLEDDTRDDCPAGQPCVNRFCQCQNDDQCADGHTCIEGFCIRLCTASQDCPSGACVPFGGDGCAANCTQEDVRRTRLDPARSPLRIQQASFTLNLNLRGTQVLRTGRPRTRRVLDPQGNVITEPGELPVTVKAADPAFEPLVVRNLACACIRTVPVPDLFGPNIAGVGKIACGDEGLHAVDYTIIQDHNTTPGNPGNGNVIGGLPQLPDDPECDDEFTFPSGVPSTACRELSDPDCSDPTAFFHPGVCNSPRTTRSSGAGPRGSASIDASIAIGLLSDAGSCDLTEPRNPDGSCRFRDYGPDCIPCTSDDRDMGTPENLTLTTGVAAGAVYDAGNVPSIPIYIDAAEPGRECVSNDQCLLHEDCVRTCAQSGFLCSSDGDCGSLQHPNDACRSRRCEVLCEFGKRCLISQTGAPFSCDLLLAEPSDGLGGAALAFTFADVDARQIGDNVTSALLALE